jgi:transposase
MFLGIDIAKNSVDVALIKGADKPRHKVFANTPTGHQHLLAWLRDHGADPAQARSVHASLEATGTLGEALALALVEAGHVVSRINPAQIKAFGQSQLSRTKTDKADAHLIARFCQMHRPPAWTPPAPEVRELQALVRRLEALQEMRQMEDNRLQAGASTAAVLSSLHEHLQHLDTQIKQTKQQIADHIDQHPTLKRQKDLLVSIPGIAGATAAALLAELLDVSQFDRAAQVAAFAGLVPRIRQSGSSVRSRPCLSKAGSPRLRRALYFPAMVALRFNAPIKALGERLAARGKSKMLILGAAMRKLLHLVFGILKSDKPFDPNFSVARA